MLNLLFNNAAMRHGHSGAGVEVEVGGGQRVRARALVGADGVGSVVASLLQVGQPSYAGYIGYRFCPSPPALLIPLQPCFRIPLLLLPKSPPSYPI